MTISDEHWKCISERAAALFIEEAQAEAKKATDAAAAAAIAAQQAVLAAQSELLKDQQDQAANAVYLAALDVQKAVQKTFDEAQEAAKVFGTVQGQIECVYRHNHELLFGDPKALKAACDARELVRAEASIAETEAKLAEDKAALAALKA